MMERMGECTDTLKGMLALAIVVDGSGPCCLKAHPQRKTDLRSLHSGTDGSNEDGFRAAAF